MAKLVANVVISTDTFASWVSKTNILLDTLSNEIVTVDTSTSGANTSGNGSVIGTLSANTFGTLLLRGGGVGNTANVSSLTIGISNSSVSSNVTVTGYQANIVANSLFVSSNTTIATNTISINTTSIAVDSSTFTSNSANATFTGAVFNVGSSNATFSGDQINASSNVAITGANTSITGTVTISNTATITGNVYVGTSVTFAGNNSAVIQSSDNFIFPGDGTTSNVVDNFAISEFTGAKYTIRAKNNSNTDHIVLTELTTVYGASNAHSTEYGTIFSNTRFMTFSVDANTTHVRLLAVSNSSVTNANISIVKTAFK